jgi:hypothetical protein
VAILAVVMTHVVTFVAATWIWLSFSGTCSYAASPEDYRTGRLALVGLAIVLLACWGAVVARAERTSRLTGFALASLALPLLYLTHLLAIPRSDWTFCLFQF